MSDLYDIAREVTDAVLKPITLRIGGRYVHPDDGPIQITSGCYRDSIYGRISNHWHWIVEATGEEHYGYGGHWPENPDLPVPPDGCVDAVAQALSPGAWWDRTPDSAMEAHKNAELKATLRAKARRLLEIAEAARNE